MLSVTICMVDHRLPDPQMKRGLRLCATVPGHNYHGNHFLWAIDHTLSESLPSVSQTQLATLSKFHTAGVLIIDSFCVCCVS